MSTSAPTVHVQAPSPATIRELIVCVPDGLDTSVLHDSTVLDRHFGVTGTTRPRFWTTRSLHHWQHRHLIDLRPGRPRYCAGGPLALLDLAGVRYAAAVGAGIRYQQWSAAVTGTRHATPWPVYAQRSAEDPGKYPEPRARAEFNAQPRVSAMRIHNAVAFGAGILDIGDLEMFQAGPAAYANYHALWACATDAVLTADGRQLTPASDHLVDRITYLDQATRYLAGLPRTQRILAVAL